MKPKYILTTALLFLFFFYYLPAKTTAAANIQKKTKTRLKVYYEKLANSDKKISIILFQGTGKKMKGIENAELVLTTFDLDNERQLTTIYTDANGNAMLIIEAKYLFPKDERGYSVVKVMYSGNDSLKAAQKKVKFMDLNVDVSFEIVDSIKLITVSTFEIDSIGNPKPIEGVKLNIGVERLFSTLYLSKIETNKKGIGTMEFPEDIAGDSIGTINVIVKIDDNDDYGTITKAKKINWGTIVDYSNVSENRSLFGDEAPLWMIISVFVVLAGAWYHFILAIYKVLKIKKIEPKILNEPL